MIGCGDENSFDVGEIRTSARQRTPGQNRASPLGFLWYSFTMFKKTCSEPNCTGKHKAHGLCKTHYQKFRKDGTLYDISQRPRPMCSVDGCESTVLARKLCNAHYHRQVKERRFSHVRECVVTGCRSGVQARYLCSPHYASARRYQLSPLQLDSILLESCNLCGSPPPGNHVDHDHSCCDGSRDTCGRCIRGVLCSLCNTGLGCFKEQGDLLLRAREYLSVGMIQL